MSTRILPLVAATLFLISCSMSELPKEPYVGNVTTGLFDTGVLKTAPGINDLEENVDVSQMVTLKIAGQNLVFETHVSRQADHFIFAALDLLGRRAVTIDWHGGDISYWRAPWMPDQLDPKQILADLILIYWPVDLVRVHLESGASLTEAPGLKQIFQGDQERARVVWTGGSEKGNLWPVTLHYANELQHYELDIKSSEIKP